MSEEEQVPQEAPAKRHAVDTSTAPRTSPAPLHTPQGKQEGFKRPKGVLPAATRLAGRIKSRRQEKSRAR